MRKSFLLILFFAIAIPVLADEWDDFGNIERMWDGQKSITNKEFNQVIDALEANKKQKEEKQLKKKIKKVSGGGTTLHTELNPDKEIREIPDLKNKGEEGILVNVPATLILGEKVLDKGYYKVVARKDENNKLFVSFYQSQFFKGELEVIETEDDFGEEDLNFAKIIPFNDSYMRMIFGSLDFNAYVFVPFLAE